MAAAPTPPTTRPQPILEDLFAELTWPILLKAARLAFRPARIGIALMFLLAANLLLSIGDRMDGSTGNGGVNVLALHGEKVIGGLRAFASGVWVGDSAGAAGGLVSAFITTPRACLFTAPWATIIIFPMLLMLTAITGGAMCRTAGTELAWMRPIPWPSAVAMGLSRWKSLVGALLLPLALVWIAGLVLAVAGWVLFSVGLLSIAGGLFWLVFLAVGVVVALVLLGIALGHWMLIPAVVCEGADAIDATQHTLALVFARPLRLVAYLLVLAAQGLLLGLIVGVVVAAAVGFARTSAGAWLDPSHAAILDEARPHAIPALDKAAGAPQAAGDLARTGAGLVRVSTTVFVLAGWAVMVSYLWCAATALFLAMRRVCDGQDIGELWSPGMVGGTFAAASNSTPSAIDSPPIVVSEAIVDNGPADDR